MIFTYPKIRKYGRIVTIKVIDGLVYFFRLPYKDAQVAADAREAKKNVSQKGLSAIEQLCIDRGGTITDIRK